MAEALAQVSGVSALKTPTAMTPFVFVSFVILLYLLIGL